MEANKDVTQRPFRVERPDEYVTDYANNIALEASVWDLKIIFGQQDQAANTLVQHTAITIPWNVAKIFSYLLQTQLIAQEIQEGKIYISPALIPPVFPPPPPELADDPAFKKTYEAITKMRESFLERL